MEGNAQDKKHNISSDVYRLQGNGERDGSQEVRDETGMKYDPRVVLAWFRQHKIPCPADEYKFHPNRKWRFDFAWPDEKVALEVQGGLFTGGRHSRGAALLKEHEKLNAAASAGWRVLYCIPQNLCMPETIELIKQSLCLKS